MLRPETSLEDLRRGVREWCAAHVPHSWRDRLRGAGHDELVAFLRWWATELRDAGLLAPHWPEQWGGGFSIPEQVVIAEELARGDAPRNALAHVAPTVLRSATEEQRRAILTGILAGDVWCQGSGTLDDDPTDWLTSAAVTPSYVGRACSEVCALGLRVHRGIGFTWEHDSHLYLKRAKLEEVLFGTPSWHRRRLARTLVDASKGEPS